MFLLGQCQECAETRAGPPVSVGSVWCSAVLPQQQWGQPHGAVTSGSPAPPSRHRQPNPATADTELSFFFSLKNAPSPLHTGWHPSLSTANYHTIYHYTLIDDTTCSHYKLLVSCLYTKCMVCLDYNMKLNNVIDSHVVWMYVWRHLLLVNCFKSRVGEFLLIFL